MIITATYQLRWSGSIADVLNKHENIHYSPSYWSTFEKHNNYVTETIEA